MRWYRWCHVNRIAFAIFWIALLSFVFARCKSPDFYRAGHRIVKPTLLLSFFCSTRGMQARMFIKQYSLQYFLIITENIKNLNKNAHSRVHSPPLVSITRASVLGPRHRRMQPSKSKGEPQFVVGPTAVSVSASARVLDHSLWYGDKLVAQ